MVEDIYQELISNLRPCEGLFPTSAPELTEWFEELNVFKCPPVPKIELSNSTFLDLSIITRPDGTESHFGNYYSKPNLKRKAASDLIVSASKKYKSISNSEELTNHIEQNSLKCSNMPNFNCTASLHIPL